MIWMYDNTICNDLSRSFNPENSENPVVKVVNPEEIIGLAAQIKNDDVTFPIVALSRDPDTSIDRDRLNFSRLHKGVQAVLNEETNELFYEKSLPINLSYKITVLTTNTADMDEIVRELLFKYTDMYFLTMTLPYEAKRKVRFGLTIDPDGNIERSSSISEYISAGQLYQSIVPLKVEGAVLVTYTSAKLIREGYEISAISHSQAEYLNLV